DRRLGRGSLGLRLGLGELRDLRVDGGDPLAKRDEVADGIRGFDRLGEVTCRLRDVRGRRAGLRALLEEPDLPGEIGVLALEVRERLLRRRVRVFTDESLVVADSDVDGTGLVDAAPLGRTHAVQLRVPARGRFSVLSDRERL